MCDGQMATLFHKVYSLYELPMPEANGAGSTSTQRWTPVPESRGLRYMFRARRVKSSQALPVKEDRASRRQMASCVSSS